MEVLSVLDRQIAKLRCDRHASVVDGDRDDRPLPSATKNFFVKMKLIKIMNEIY